MTRRPAYAYLSPKEQREVDERDLLILAMWEEGHSLRAIADHLGLHVNTVGNVTRALREHL